MNKLYGLLTAGIQPVSGYYAKLHTPVQHSSISERITEDFVRGIPAARLPAFACAVCAMAASSRFGREIRELDPENTYALYGRDPSASAESGADCVWDLLKPEKDMKYMYRHLDQDIRDRLCTPPYPDIAGGVCLQILRTSF